MRAALLPAWSSPNFLTTASGNPGQGWRCWYRSMRRTSLPITVSERYPPFPRRMRGRGVRSWQASAVGERIRVMLAEDEPETREALAALLGAEDELIVVGAAEDADGAIELARRER